VRDLSTSYALALAGLLTPVAGLHHFYLDKPVMGVLYLVTWGFCGIGTLVDLIRLPTMVENANMLLAAGPIRPALPPPESEEQLILKAAQKHSGALTVALASVETGLELDRSRTVLERMAKSGFCSRDVSEEAVDLYVFPGLRSNKPFEI